MSPSFVVRNLAVLLYVAISSSLMNCKEQFVLTVSRCGYIAWLFEEVWRFATTFERVQTMSPLPSRRSFLYGLRLVVSVYLRMQNDFPAKHVRCHMMKNGECRVLALSLLLP